jgi:hypothetical protein
VPAILLFDVAGSIGAGSRTPEQREVRSPGVKVCAFNFTDKKNRRNKKINMANILAAVMPIISLFFIVRKLIFFKVQVIQAKSL